MDANIALGYLAYSGLLPGAEQIGPDEAKKDLALAKKYFEKAKGLNTNGTWSGAPKDFVEATAVKAAPEKEKVASRGVEVSTGKEEEGGVSGFLWDNALSISAGLVGLSFAYHLYKKNC